MAPEDGVFVVSSPYTWKREHADPEVWIGGKMKDGKPYHTQDGLVDLVHEYSGGKAYLLEACKVPFVIPDSDGTFQFTFSNCTIFTNKPKV